MSVYVDLETAKKTSGVRLVTVGGLPSPWSEAAKGLLRLAGVPFVAVRLMPGDKEVREWTRAQREYFEERPSALDVHAACAVNIFVPPPEERCAMFPPLRAAFESMRGVLAEPPPSLVALRDRMYERRLPTPIEV
jgi:hypothetical protein